MFGIGIKRRETQLASRAFVTRGLEEPDARFQGYLDGLCRTIERCGEESEGLRRAASELDEFVRDLFAATVMAASLLTPHNLFGARTSEIILSEVEGQLTLSLKGGDRSWMPNYVIELWKEASAVDAKGMEIIATRFLTDLGLDEVDPDLFAFMTGPLFMPILTIAHTDQPMMHFWRMVKNKGRLG